MSLAQKALELLKSGIKSDEIVLKMFEFSPTSESKDIEEAITIATKAIELDKKKIDVCLTAQKKSEFEAAVKIATDEALKKLASTNIGLTRVKEVDGAWKQDVADAFKLFTSGQKTSKQYIELKEKSFNVCREKYGEKALDGIITATDAAGGYFMRPEFDMEVDRLIYQSSGLIDSMKIRQGGEKTEINSISSFNFVYRTNENTAYTVTKPTFDQLELKYKEAGAIVSMSKDAIMGSVNNLIQDLTENAMDAKIRLVEPLVITGKAGTDPFNGIWFTSGITSINCKNKGGTGKITNKDLTSMFLASPAQSRKNGKFYMDSRELFVLLEEPDLQGQKLNAIETINGKFFHKATGKEIICVDTLPRTLNGVTDATTGSDVAVVFADLQYNFRYYEFGGMQIDESKEIYFEYDQIALRFILRNKQGIPTQSKTSHVILLGVKSVAV